MKPTLALLSAVALMVACDNQGSVIGGSFSDRLDSAVTSTSGGTITDTTPVDTSSGYVTLQPSDLEGPSNLPPWGTARRAYFYLATDQSLHVVGTSDGAPAGGTGPTAGRQTDWDIQLISLDSIRANWVTNSTEAGMRDTLWNFKDTAGGPIYNVVRLRYHVRSGGPEVRVAASPKALIWVRVYAWSGVDTKVYGWTPPRLSDDTVSTLVWAGNPATQVGTWGFYIRMP